MPEGPGEGLRGWGSGMGWRRDPDPDLRQVVMGSPRGTSFPRDLGNLPLGQKAS